ncbi:hypothetical protein GHT09_009426 [Marmota monax]|uniref:FAD-binding FR-type domain-containing protein n=1 Tax=Marmota monax TaxID=9995 RepID=A0A834PNF7_MARMO|nr:hypothetical protein GHT09_009426 [Marmota monax]
MENLTISAACWLTPPANRRPLHRPRPLTAAYWHNHRNQLLCLATYTGLQVLLFVLAANAHRALGASIMVAKGCGQCLNFNCSFIAVLMLRRCLTWLRATWLAQVLPLDYVIQFHQLMGYMVVGLSLVHTVAHVVNFALLAQSGASPFQFWELLLTTRPGIGWVHGSASPTGVALLLLLLLMVICSSPCVRRSGHFQVFYWTHLSYLPLWILLILHGPNFWKWLLVPGILFLLEKAMGLIKSRMAPLSIVEVNLLPSKVTHLIIQRPPLFHYRPGDYLYLNIPTIARYEWHPFTISSAPEQKDTIELHIRSQGQWTNRLYESFKVSDPVGCDSKRLSRSLRMRRSQRKPQASEMSSENHRFCNIKCYIDGPYGTSTRRIFASEHAVLIGAGIGITPFASILQSIMHRHQKRKHVCPSCQHSWMEGLQDHDMKLHKVDFIWINRDQRSFEWFVSLLTKLEMDQAQEAQDDHFLELHMYMTSALGKNDMKAIGLQMALDLLAKKEKKDSITGLQTRTQPGRPDWSKHLPNDFSESGKFPGAVDQAINKPAPYLVGETLRQTFSGCNGDLGCPKRPLLSSIDRRTGPWSPCQAESIKAVTALQRGFSGPDGAVSQKLPFRNQCGPKHTSRPGATKALLWQVLPVFGLMLGSYMELPPALEALHSVPSASLSHCKPGREDILPGDRQWTLCFLFGSPAAWLLPSIQHSYFKEEKTDVREVNLPRILQAVTMQNPGSFQNAPFLLYPGLMEIKAES